MAREGEGGAPPFRVMMLDVEGTLLREIADRRLTRDDVMLTYAFGIRDCPDDVRWAVVNAAIVERWSMAALSYIKKGAWKLVEERTT